MSDLATISTFLQQEEVTVTDGKVVEAAVAHFCKSFTDGDPTVTIVSKHGNLTDAANTVLLDGEIMAAKTKDSVENYKLYVGDGTSKLSSLQPITGLSEIFVQPNTLTGLAGINTLMPIDGVATSKTNFETVVPLTKNSLITFEGFIDLTGSSYASTDTNITSNLSFVWSSVTDIGSMYLRVFTTVDKTAPQTVTETITTLANITEPSNVTASILHASAAGKLGITKFDGWIATNTLSTGTLTFGVIVTDSNKSQLAQKVCYTSAAIAFNTK